MTSVIATGTSAFADKTDLLGSEGAAALRDYLKDHCRGNERKVEIKELWRHDNGEISGKFYNRSKQVARKRAFGKTYKVTVYSHSTTLHFHGEPNETRPSHPGKQIFLAGGDWVRSNKLASIVEGGDD
jgi:hypothetical protein